MASFLTIAISGLGFGVLYGMLGSGLVVVYRATRVLNFAYGDMVTLLAYVAFAIFSLTNSYTAMVIGIALCAVVIAVGFKIGLVDLLGKEAHPTLRIYGNYSNDTILNIIIGTVAFGLVIQGLEARLWGEDARTIPGIGGDTVWTLGHVHVATNVLVNLAVALVLFGGLAAFFKLSVLGKQVQATFDNAYGATLIGIDVRKVFTVAWVISMVLGAVAGLLAAPVTYISSTSLVTFSFVAFCGIIVGGLTSIWGAVLGGCILGVAQNLVAAYISPDVEKIMIFVIVLVILIVKPYGLLGNKAAFLKRV